jgi:hypothetical protein
VIKKDFSTGRTFGAKDVFENVLGAAVACFKRVLRRVLTDISKS